MRTTTTSLLEGLKSKSPAAIVRFNKYYVPVILKLCLDGCKDAEAAQNVTADVVRVLFSRMDDFDPDHRGSFRNYIKTITLSRINDFGRKQNALKKRLERRNFLEQFDRYLLRRVIADLKNDTSIQKRSWEMFFLHYEEKVAEDEIAEKFGIASESVKRSLARIRTRIRLEIDE